jgi:type VI secretion system protein
MMNRHMMNHNAVSHDVLFRRMCTVVLLLCMACMFSACATSLFGQGEKVKWQRVTLSASDDANNNSPIAIDIVLVSDANVLSQLETLPASKWFASRADLVNTYPTGVRYRSWELVPGQQMEVGVKTLEGPKVLGAFVFANYPGAGAHRIRINALRGHLVARLETTTFSVSVTK